LRELDGGPLEPHRVPLLRALPHLLRRLKDLL
jgi:hypothetical protein